MGALALFFLFVIFTGSAAAKPSFSTTSVLFATLRFFLAGLFATMGSSSGRGEGSESLEAGKTPALRFRSDFLGPTGNIFPDPTVLRLAEDGTVMGGSIRREVVSLRLGKAETGLDLKTRDTSRLGGPRRNGSAQRSLTNGSPTEGWAEAGLRAR